MASDHVTKLMHSQLHHNEDKKTEPKIKPLPSIKYLEAKVVIASVDLVISETALPEDFIYKVNENFSSDRTFTSRYSENMQSEVAQSEITSQITTSVQKSKDPEKLDIQAVCLGFKVAKLKMLSSTDLTKYSKSLQKYVPVISNCSGKVGVQDLYLSVSKETNGYLIYP